MKGKRLTDLKGVANGLPRTPEGAREALRRYNDQNSDLPVHTRHLLGLAALGRYFGRRNLEAAVGQTLPRFPFRDWSWRWWNVLLASGLEEHWTVFSERASSQGARAACQTLRRSVTATQYATLLRRAGTNPHNDHRTKDGRAVWAKGGTWDRRSSLTRLLVLKEHLPQRSLNRWQEWLGHERIYLLENELMRLIDPDKMLRHECIDRAYQYVQRRIPEMLGWPQQKSVGPKVLAWFFQTRINTSIGTLVPLASGEYLLRRDKRQIVAW